MDSEAKVPNFSTASGGGLPFALRSLELKGGEASYQNAVTGQKLATIDATALQQTVDEKALALLAEADGVSKQEATVRAIREAAARRVREDKVRRLSAAARDRYADLLDRLGQ